MKNKKLKVKTLKKYLVSRFIMMIILAIIITNVLILIVDIIIKLIGEQNAREIEASIEINSILSFFVAIIVIVFIFGLYVVPYGICILIYSKMVTKKVAVPVSEITDAMQEISKGNKEILLDFKTEYEFIGMRDTFNYMVKEMRKVEEIQCEYEKQRNLMLSGMAHDLKNPIMTISGYSRALFDNVVDSEEKKQEYLMTIYNKSIHINELVASMLEYTKLDSKGFVMQYERVDLLELIRTNIAELYPEIENKQIELEIEIPDSKVFVNIDRVHFSRALSNIIVNAIKHNTLGTKILILYKNDDGHRILIYDDGYKIPPAIKDNIFEPFIMGDESRSSKNGSGIGLSISMKIIKMHGGNIEIVESINGYTKGFLVTIPITNL